MLKKGMTARRGGEAGEGLAAAQGRGPRDAARYKTARRSCYTHHTLLSCWMCLAIVEFWSIVGAWLWAGLLGKGVPLIASARCAQRNRYSGAIYDKEANASMFQTQDDLGFPPTSKDHVFFIRHVETIL